MKLQFQTSSLGALRDLPEWCALLAPKQGSPFPISTQSLAPTTRKLPPNQSCLPSCSLHDLYPVPFSARDTIEFA
jgi:hypothetical protein